MADGYNPFQPAINPNMRQTNLWDLRMMSAANRMETPFERGARSSRGRSILSSMGGGMSDTPDYSAFTYDPVMRAAAEKAGVTPLEASQVRQNTILPNSGFFGSHPKLAAAIEGGIYGAAATRPSDTVGEGISNVAASLIEAPQARQAVWKRQFEGPFQASAVLEGLQDRQQKRSLQEADIQHLRALNEHLENGDDYKAQQLMETNRHNEAVEAIRDAQGETSARRAADLARHQEAMEGIALQRKTLEQQGKPPKVLGFNKKTNRYETILPGTTGDVVPLNALEAGQKQGEMMRQRWVQKHSDDLAASRKALGTEWKPEFAKDAKARDAALGKFYDDNLADSPADYVYTPQGLVPGR